MEALFANIKRVHRELPSDEFAAFFEVRRDAWAAAVATASTITLTKIGRWAVSCDDVPVFKSIADRVDAAQLISTAIDKFSWSVIRWAASAGYLHTPLKSESRKIERLIGNAAESGSIEQLEWLIAHMEPPNVGVCMGVLGFAASSKKLEVIAWLLEHGAVWDRNDRRELLTWGFVEALKLYPPAPADVGGRDSALNEATSSGSIPTIEWVVDTFFPAGDFDPSIIILKAMFEDHPHVLRWLHESGVPAEAFRRGGPERPARLLIHSTMWRSISLECMKALHELCAFTREELSDGDARVFRRDDLQLDTLVWLQKTFQFSLSEMRAGEILERWVVNEHPENLEWLVRAFEFSPADWQNNRVLRRLAKRTKYLPVLEWLHRAQPVTPETVLRVCPDILKTLIMAGNVKGLEWFYAEVGVRSENPALLHVALTHVYGTKTLCAVLHVLADTYGVTRSAFEIPTQELVRSAAVLQILHEKFGIGLEDIRRVCWRYVCCDRPDLIRVCTEVIGMSFREFRQNILSRGFIRSRDLAILRNEAGMSADDWRRDDYAALRTHTVAGQWYNSYATTIPTLFAVFGLGPADATALLATPGICPAACRTFQALC